MLRGNLCRSPFICKLILSDSVLTTQVHSTSKPPRQGVCQLECERMPLLGMGRAHCLASPRVLWETEKSCFKVMTMHRHLNAVLTQAAAQPTSLTPQSHRHHPKHLMSPFRMVPGTRWPVRSKLSSAPASTFQDNTSTGAGCRGSHLQSQHSTG